MKLTKKSPSVLQYADMAEPVGSPQQPATQFENFGVIPNPEHLRSSVRFSGFSTHSVQYPEASTSTIRFSNVPFPDETSSTVAFAYTTPFPDASATTVHLPIESTAYLVGNNSEAFDEKPQEIVLGQELRDALAQHNHRSDEDPDYEEDDEEEEEEYNYPGKGKLTVIMMSLYISVFLMALDRTIVGVAVPHITDEFHSIGDIGWYSSSYMLTSCGFILFFGKLYTFLPTKLVFLTGIIIFEVGSALCGAAPNSLSLIIGRAIAGFGSSGIFTGAITILIKSVPLHKRPLFQGLFGACYGVASVAGPLMGGVFTEGRLGWRWCFYINLPLGAFTVAALVLFLHLEENKPRLTWGRALWRLDPIGNILFLPAIVSLLLALQWGGSEYSWSSWRVIVCLSVFGFLIILWVGQQYYARNGNATIPLRILGQRSVAFGSFYMFCLGATMLTLVVYIPLWFQAIKDVSPVKSGIDTLPLVLGLVFMSIVVGGGTAKLGYYTQFVYLGSIFMSVGSGLLTTLDGASNHSKWIGFQAIAGMGIGFGMQVSNLAVQTVLHDRDVPIGTAVIMFWQTFGGAIFNSVGQNVFIDKFQTKLSLIPGVPHNLIGMGATALRAQVPPAALPAVLNAYNFAIVQGPFLACTITACLTIIGALGMEWRSVKEKKDLQMGTARNNTRVNLTKDLESANISKLKLQDMANVEQSAAESSVTMSGVAFPGYEQKVMMMALPKEPDAASLSSRIVSNENLTRNFSKPVSMQGSRAASFQGSKPGSVHENQ